MDLPMAQNAEPGPRRNGSGQRRNEAPAGPTAGRPTQSQNAKPFPATKAEALQFSNDLLQVLYDERTHGNIVKQLSEVPQESIGHGVGVIAGNIVGNRVADVRGQTGRKLEMKLVVDAVKAVITELSEIAEGEGFFTLAPADRKTAFITVVDMLDKMGTRARRQPMPPAQQPMPPAQPGQGGM